MGAVGEVRPVVAVAKQVAREAPTWLERIDDPRPDSAECVPWQEWQRQTGVDQVDVGPGGDLQFARDGLEVVARGEVWSRQEELDGPRFGVDGQHPPAPPQQLD